MSQSMQQCPQAGRSYLSWNVFPEVRKEALPLLLIVNLHSFVLVHDLFLYQHLNQVIRKNNHNLPMIWGTDNVSYIV